MSDSTTLHIDPTVAPAAASDWDVLREPQDMAGHSRAWLQLLVDGMGGAEQVLQMVVVLGRPNVGPFQPTAHWPQGQPVSEPLARAAEQALAVRSPVQVAGSMLVWAVPVLADGDLLGVVAVRFRQAGLPPRASAWMRWGQGWLVASALRSPQAQASLQDDLMFMVDAIMLAMSGDELRTSTQAVLIEVAHRLQAERISLGVASDGAPVRLWSMSHSGDFSGRLALVRGLEAAMDEATDQASVIEHQRNQDGAGASGDVLTRAHSDYLHLSAGSAMLTVPHAVDTRLTLVFAFEWPQMSLVETHRHLATGLVPVLARVIAERRRAQASWWRRIGDDLRQAAAWLVGARHAWAKAIMLAVAVTLVSMALIRVPLEVPGDARIEGAVLRQVHAPFDGFVAQSQVRAGQQVRAGEVLAVLDDRDLRLEVDRWESEQAQYRNQFQDAQAQKKLAQIQINLAQTRAAQAQKALSESNLQRSRVRAPMSGLIVSGDLTQSLGGPVQKGQLLFEIAPLEDYRVVVMVNERDIDLLREGQQGRLMLTALSGQDMPLKLQRITPVTEVVEGNNAFRVEASLLEAPLMLRPGMKGVARIEAGHESLLWVWTRTLVEWARLAVWKWWGL